jgi:hypothetical protein
MVTQQQTGTLWPCFICGVSEVCTHREPEIVAWVRTAPPQAVAGAWSVAASAERIAPGRATASQAEMFETRRWAL